MKSLFHNALALTILAIPAGLQAAGPQEETKGEEQKKTVIIGAQAPEFKIEDSQGQTIDLAKLTDQGPVLVRLTCGCAGCDKELTYFQTLHEEYAGQGLTSLAIFREPDKKVESYVKQKNLKMLYAVDTKGASWNIFQTKVMPTNFLIEKGGKIRSIAAGCDPSGLLANKVSEKVAELLKTDQVDVQQKVAEKK